MKRLGRMRAAIFAGALALVMGVGAAQAETAELEVMEAEAAEPARGLVMQMAADSGEALDVEAVDAEAAPVAEGKSDAVDLSAPPGPINWFHGLIGEKDGVEPGLLWRPTGMPAPFGATLLNFALFVFIIVRFGSKPIAAALSKRKDTIMRDIDDASRMRAASEKRLAEYTLRLEKIEEDLDRIRREFREQGERERERILAEANERRERMRKDAEFLLSQELLQMRQDLQNETVEQAIRGAAELLSVKLTPSEQERYLESFLLQLPARTGSAKGSEAAAAKGGLS